MTLAILLSAALAADGSDTPPAQPQSQGDVVLVPADALVVMISRGTLTQNGYPDGSAWAWQSDVLVNVCEIKGFTQGKPYGKSAYEYQVFGIERVAAIRITGEDKLAELMDGCNK